ncbi:universal stress protein [Kordia sp. YSTF-M3]|uniref:Universal stress protein n=1 Tax=Kordia aestuariivivens TaxID=2759037 RepID=A0ABR7QEQ2_9FLAO|nr:universal stress protein [Kordia aestuariivivens]MBC8757051.1 universal stress protein [Kordia aestuariivivens]
MRKILVPTDFSANAMNALKFALELFKYDRSEFFIMHTYQDEIYADNALLKRENVAKAAEVIGAKAEQQLNEILEAVHEISPNPRHTYTIVSANNTLIDESDSIVDRENIDCIVMGTRGQTNDRKFTFGSNTLQVLKYVQSPVLAIPENYTYTPPRHILFPTNYMIPYKRRELKLVCEMASKYKATIDMLHVSKSGKLSIRQEDNQQFLRDELCKNTLNFKTTNNTSISNAIYTYIKENAIDMLVMVNTRRSFLEDILLQSTIKKLSLYIDIPFLALQNVRRD